MPYKHADVKYNNGEGALLCSNCRVIIAYGHDHEDKKHYCDSCAALNELARQGQEWGLE